MSVHADHLLFVRAQVPESAQAIYQHTDRFRQQIGSLDLMVSLYNKLQRTTLPVEWPLVASRLEAVGKYLATAPVAGPVEDAPEL